MVEQNRQHYPNPPSVGKDSGHHFAPDGEVVAFSVNLFHHRSSYNEFAETL